MEMISHHSTRIAPPTHYTRVNSILKIGLWLAYLHRMQMLAKAIAQSKNTSSE
jgi:hypothetical protein